MRRDSASTTRATATSTSCAPLYEFGYGLSYTTFKVSNLRLSSHAMDARRGSVRARVDVTNTGSRAGDDVAQLYIHDPVASLSQPVRRLRGFERVTLEPGQTKTVSWKLSPNDVGFYDNRGPLPRGERHDRGLRRRHLERGRQPRLVRGDGRSAAGSGDEQKTLNLETSRKR